MTFQPAPSSIALRMVSTNGPWAGFPRATTTGGASTTFESADVGVYLPLLVPVTCVVRRLWWANGATVSASHNVDVALYADAGRKPGTRLVSTGSTAQGTASQVQFVDVTDTTIGPGLYWLAIACSSGSTTFFSVGGPLGDALFRFEQSAALPLPATASPVEATNSKLYVVGFATTASP